MRSLLLTLAFTLAAMAQLATTPASLASLQRQAAEARDQNRIPDAIRLYRDCVRLQPNWTEGWWYLGTLLYDQNSFAPAKDALLKVVQLEPNSPSPAWALLGLAEYQTNNYADSLKHFERSFLGDREDNPFGRASRYHAALLYTRAGQFEMALGRLAQISSPDTETPELVRAIGAAALRIPNLAPAQFEIADAAGHAQFDRFVRREQDAEAKITALLAQYPKRPELHHLHGTFLLTSDPAKAIEEFKTEITISPRHTAARLQIAFEYLKEGEPAKALPYAREAAAIDPQSFAAHNAMGQALVETGDLKAGIAELEKARAIAPDSAETHLALASAYAKAGRPADAAREREAFTRLKNLRDNGAR